MRYLEKFSISKQTKEQELAGQIYEWSNRKLNFGLLMKNIKGKGYQFIYECFNEAKQGNAKDPYKIFMYLIGKTKVELK